MGVLVTWSPPVDGAEWDYAKVYRSDAEAGDYALQTTVGITTTAWWDVNGTDDYWYKVTYYYSDTTVESDYSQVLQGGTYSGYTYPSAIRRFMGLSSADEPGNYTLGEMIHLAGAELDQDYDVPTAPRTTAQNRFIMLMANYLVSSKICENRAQAAIHGGTVSFSIGGVSVQKSSGELKEKAKYYYEKYLDLTRKGMAHEGYTTPMADGVCTSAAEDMTDMLHGVSNAQDYEDRFGENEHSSTEKSRVF